MYRTYLLIGTITQSLILLVALVIMLPARASALPLSLYLVDSGNNRILKFGPPFSNGMDANVVLGQTSFTDGNSGLSQNALHSPIGIDHDSSGNLFVADSQNNRVLEFAQPLSTGQEASLVIGQPDFTTNLPGTGFNRMRYPAAVAIDRRSSGAIFVAVQAHVRQFQLPFFNGMNATLQLGNNGSISQTISPLGLALNNQGNLFVSDAANLRVLEYKTPIRANQLASVVLGSSSLDHRGQGVFSFPDGSAIDAHGNFWIADYGASRVLEFAAPFYNGKLPSLVIAQPNFTSQNPSLSQSGMANPSAVAFDGAGDLWVADTSNNRVLEFVPPFSNAMNAAIVIGQPDFVSNSYGTSASQILAPGGLTFAP